MKISVASGKGGTGKTTIATNLAAVLAEQGHRVTYLDCDVEEPNGHIFLKPDITEIRPVDTLIPRVNYDQCTFCGECAEICQYNALAVLGRQVLIFPELCHSCGGCSLLCPENAIEEIPRRIGEVGLGTGREMTFIDGKLNVGEAQAPPVTKAVKKAAADNDSLFIIDAPPGTSCPVIEAVRGSDFVLLVTEPTPFGINDLKLAVEMLRIMKLPFAVVVNRSDIGDDRVDDYCRDENIDIVLKIPNDRNIAETCSGGRMIIDDNRQYKDGLLNLFRGVRERTAS